MMPKALWFISAGGLPVMSGLADAADSVRRIPNPGT
jgi:hypothetical protein